MSSEQEWIRSEYKEVILYLFLGIFLVILIPLLNGFSGRGFEESFVEGMSLVFGEYITNYIIYIPFFIASLLLIIFPIARVISLNKSENPITKPNPSWFRIFTISWIYSPEENGLLWKVSESLGFKGKDNFMRWTLNPLRVLVVSILIFGVYGLLLVMHPQLAVSGVPQLQLQQVTLGSEVAFSSFVPSFSENGFLLFIFSILCGIAVYITSKVKGGYTMWYGIIIFLCVLMGFLWGSLHSLVYPNSDASYWATVLFGFVGTLITVLTGIFLFWLIWHIMNNAFITMAQLITIKEDIIFIVGISLFVLLISWLSIEYLARKKKRGNLQNISIPSE